MPRAPRAQSAVAPTRGPTPEPTPEPTRPWRLGGGAPAAAAGSDARFPRWPPGRALELSEVPGAEPATAALGAAAGLCFLRATWPVYGWGSPVVLFALTLGAMGGLGLIEGACEAAGGYVWGGSGRKDDEGGYGPVASSPTERR